MKNKQTQKKKQKPRTSTQQKEHPKVSLFYFIYLLGQSTILSQDILSQERQTTIHTHITAYGQNSQQQLNPQFTTNYSNSWSLLHLLLIY